MIVGSLTPRGGVPPEMTIGAGGEGSIVTVSMRSVCSASEKVREIRRDGVEG